jgi:WD40 repeat protein
MMRTKATLFSAIVALVIAPEIPAGQPPKVARDQHGDVLPAGAVARLGSRRWRHTAPVCYVAFAPDGKSVVSAGVDGYFRVWEYPSGKELRRFGPEAADIIDAFWRTVERHIDYAVFPMPFAVSSDTKVAAMGGIKEIALFDVATGQKLPPLSVPEDQQNGWRGIGPITFAPDGRHLVSMGKSIQVWDVATSKLERAFGKGTMYQRDSHVLAYSPDGKRLLTSVCESRDDKYTYLLRRWDPFTGQRLGTERLDREVFAATFSPNGELLAQSRYESVVLLDAATGKEIRTWRTDSQGHSMVFAHDGKTLFKRLCGATIGEWDVATGKLLRYLGPPLSNAEWFLVFNAPLALSPDGRTLALSGVDNAIHLVDVASGKEISSAGHFMAVDQLLFASDGSLWTGAIDCSIRKWSIPTAAELPAPSLPGWCCGYRISADGKYAIQWLSRADGLAAIDLTSGLTTTLKPQREEDHAGCLALARDGKTLAVRWVPDHRLALYDMPSLRPRHTLSTGAVDIPNGLMIISPDSRRIAALSDSKTIAVWDVVTGKLAGKVALPDGKVVFNGAFTPDGRCLVLDTEDGTVLLAEVTTGQVRCTYGTQAKARKTKAVAGGYISLNFANHAKVGVTPDGRLLVHGSPDGVVRVWDLLTGKEASSFKGHEGTILAVAVSPDGQFAASASTDTTVLVWKLPRR